MTALDLIKNYPFIYQDDEYFYLYRHQSFVEHYIKGIADSTLYFSSPQNFNDPFDSYFSLAEQPDRSFHDKILSNLDIKGNPAQKILHRKKSRFLLEQSFKEDSFFEEHFKKIGVICLNHNPLNILMWSHYADNHKGFLLEFRFPKNEQLLIKLDVLPVPVKYAEHFTKGKLDNFDVIQTYEMLYTKAMDWEYEKEFRMILNAFQSIDDKQRIYNYPQEWLCSIILGCKADFSNVKIKGILKDKTNIVSIYRAQKLPNSFGLTVPNHPRLDVLANSKKQK